MLENIITFCTFAVTVLVLLPIRTAYGSFYFIPFPFSLPLTFKVQFNG